MIELFTNHLRKYLVKNGDFRLKKNTVIDLDRIERIDDLGLYIHIPFCKNSCPYCPYNKIKYDKNLVEPFKNAIIKEIEIYGKKLENIEIESIYIGGGTPTNIIDEIGIILREIKKWFKLKGDICIETNPTDINLENLRKLKNYGVEIISCGVQSFQDKFLRYIGRNYEASILPEKMMLLKNSNFKSVNVDLIFALPGQEIIDIIYDLDKIIEFGINQVTTYPLFTFPYSSVGRFLKLKKVRMPNIIKRRLMYHIIHSYLLDNGFKRVSVWGFVKNREPRYSSVTRDFYIGFGPGAGSSLKNGYYLNTFSFKHYIELLEKGKLPLALKMDFTDDMLRYYWFYWKLYDTYINIKEMEEHFRNDRRLNKIMRLSNLLGFYEKKNGYIILTEKGSFYLHLLQNYFLLNYISKVWSKAMEEPFPEFIQL